MIKAALVAIVLVVIAVVASGCSVTVAGTPTRQPAADSADPLPFRPEHADRTNDRNDGSSFEPCTAFADAELRALGIDPDSRRDAAISDGPNYRGCVWTMPASNVRQIVTNQGALGAYVWRHDEIHWRPMERSRGRTLAVGRMYDEECLAAFKSQGAVIITLASFWHADQWPQTACEWVVEFASLAAAKAP